MNISKTQSENDRNTKSIPLTCIIMTAHPPYLGHVLQQVIGVNKNVDIKFNAHDEFLE